MTWWKTAAAGIYHHQIRFYSGRQPRRYWSSPLPSFFPTLPARRLSTLPTAKSRRSPYLALLGEIWSTPRPGVRPFHRVVNGAGGQTHHHHRLDGSSGLPHRLDRRHESSNVYLDPPNRPAYPGNGPIRPPHHEQHYVDVDEISRLALDHPTGHPEDLPPLSHPAHPPPPNHRRPLSIYDMNASRIRDVVELADLEALVDQLEELPTLTAADLWPLVLPLTRQTCAPENGVPGARLTERILFHCLGRLPPEISQRQHFHPVPPVLMYNRALIAWANTKSIQGAQRAEHILQLMMSEYAQEMAYLQQQQQQRTGAAPAPICRSPRPDRICYKSLIRAWYLTESPEGVTRCDQLLQDLEQRSGLTEWLTQTPAPGRVFRRPEDMPDMNTYNMVLSAYSKASVLHHPQALNRAKSLIQRLDRLHELCQHAADEDVGVAVKDHHHRHHRDGYLLDAVSYQGLLRVYSRFIAASPGPIDPALVSEIEAVLTRMHRQEEQAAAASEKRTSLWDNVSPSWCNSVLIDALVKTEPRILSVQRADDMLWAMATMRRQPENVQGATSDGNNTGAYSAWTSFRRLPAYMHYPDPNSILKVIRCWELSGAPVAKQKINNLLTMVMDTPYERLHFFHKALEIWTRSRWPHAPELVETILHRYVADRDSSSHIQPSGHTFVIAIMAWMQMHTDPLAPYRAELLLQKLIQLYNEDRERGIQNSRFGVREVHFRYVLTCWIQRCETGLQYRGVAGNLYPAEHIEKWVLSLEKRDWRIKVDGLFAFSLRAWTKQVVPDDQPNQVQRSAQLINKMEQIAGGIAPFPCNWVLETCSRPQPNLARRVEAYDVAIDTFRRSSRNARTYVLMVQVLKSQVVDLDEAHLKVVEDLLLECCATGNLTQEMIDHVLAIVPAESMQRIFGVPYQVAHSIARLRNTTGGAFRWDGRLPKSLLVENLPRAWSINASKTKK